MLVLSLYLVYINRIIIHCFFLNHLFIHHDKLIKFIHHMGFPGSLAQPVKNLPAVQKPWVRSLCQEDPLEKGWLPTPVFFPGEFHGQRSLEGYSS